MSDRFDPYLQWLGIPPHDHPVDHYRLLGIARFEGDAATISDAARQREALLEPHRTGTRSDDAAALLDAVAAARLCLLHVQTKDEYDSLLRRQSGVVPMGRPGGVPTPAPGAAPGVVPMSRPAPRQEYDAAAQRAAPAVAARPKPPPVPPPVPPPIPPPVGDTGSTDETSPVQRGWPCFLAALFCFALLLMGGVAGVARLLWWRMNRIEAFHEQLVEPAPFEQASQLLPVVFQKDDGEIEFWATLATIHGPNAAHLTVGQEQMIGNWTSTDDWLSWDFRVDQPAVFKVEVFYTAQRGAAGGRYELRVGDKSDATDVRATPPAISDPDILYLQVRRSGDHRLEMRAKEISSQQLMMLQTIRFTIRKQL